MQVIVEIANDATFPAFLLEAAHDCTAKILEEPMKQVLLATVAALALSVPAMAAPQHAGQPTQNTPANHMNMSSHQARGQRMQTAQIKRANSQQRVNPMQLSTPQVRLLQRKLEVEGFAVGPVDGIYGPRTASAVRRFQARQDIQAHGHLTRNTLEQLGANLGVRNANNSGRYRGQRVESSAQHANAQNGAMNNGAKQNARNETGMRSKTSGTVGAAPAGSSWNSNTGTHNTNGLRTSQKPQGEPDNQQGSTHQ